MKTFWAAVAKYAVKVAVFAAGHPDAVISIINAVKAIKK